ncbi:MAG: ATP/GTP-binding protein [Rothia sp. (in: high G+C Gram-positive bacteria)]|uniref:ATP/GTP-binding protein n=1 Tax=Rothia sp. (in: high G+C Gram-positive bacteria) TaxID=1885016 RepID=UPI0026DF7C2C|nr:ATP/GTP-binding protein [Rothia sp. (in: high G+C Gram-positive bacteria)]MDO5750783.1 ATP/GTP-binding protein [Rothia sp. (in: high G+C Gram-positive bacteria)]
MPRKNHKKASGTTSAKWARTAPEGRDISRILDPAPRIESDRYGDWLVQYIPAVNAQKNYICPECGRTIPPGVAHLVVWQDNHMMGRERGIEERRHWHQGCWRTRRR